MYILQTDLGVSFLVNTCLQFVEKKKVLVELGESSKERKKNLCLTFNCNIIHLDPKEA